MSMNKIFFTGAVAFMLVLSGCAANTSQTEETMGSTSETSAGGETLGAGDETQISGSEVSDTQAMEEQTNPLDIWAVYFAYDEAIVSEEGQQVIRAHADVLVEHPDVMLKISGHADERGTREYNLALGDERGEAVSSYFQHFGVSAERISVTSYGEERPAELGSDEESWSLNRRSEFDYRQN